MSRIVSTLVLLISGLASAAWPSQSATERNALDRRIEAPIRAKYRAIRDAREWLNPIITIRAEGVEVGSRAIPGGRKTVSTSELRALLVGLPVEAWPYGRVVLASDIGLRSVDASGRLDESDEQSIRQNHEVAERILRVLNIEMEWWPS
ncbi:MAG TPA: hypothetical protein VI485_22650 [Vicinamibacterales bacterium]|nr:hypothetical protein [Vicinamibacterales bacterium]